MAYWIPITLWSVEKTYLPRNPAHDERVRGDENRELCAAWLLFFFAAKTEIFSPNFRGAS